MLSKQINRQDIPGGPKKSPNFEAPYVNNMKNNNRKREKEKEREREIEREREKDTERHRVTE